MMVLHPFRTLYWCWWYRLWTLHRWHRALPWRVLGERFCTKVFSVCSTCTYLQCRVLFILDMNLPLCPILSAPCPTRCKRFNFDLRFDLFFGECLEGDSVERFNLHNQSCVILHLWYIHMCVYLVAWEWARLNCQILHQILTAKENTCTHIYTKMSAYACTCSYYIPILSYSELLTMDTLHQWW